MILAEQINFSYLANCALGKWGKLEALKGRVVGIIKTTVNIHSNSDQSHISFIIGFKKRFILS